jgi:uncharacterized RDD family membrane protein YckC
MDQILDSPLGTEKKLNYAGFWIRTAALIIDSIVLSLMVYPTSLILGLKMGGMQYGFVVQVVYIVYYAATESSPRQATFGKMAVGIKVGNILGERISFSNALGRYLAKIISTIILCIGFMMAGWDEKKQALHDKLANTYVFYA